jgi:hypothetical protein
MLEIIIVAAAIVSTSAIVLVLVVILIKAELSYSPHTGNRLAIYIWL